MDLTDPLNPMHEFNDPLNPALIGSFIVAVHADFSATPCVPIDLVRKMSAASTDTPEMYDSLYRISGHTRINSSHALLTTNLAAMGAVPVNVS
jgi:hypothetical protein